MPSPQYKRRCNLRALLAAAAATFLCLPAVAHSAQPEWWTRLGAINSDANDKSPLTQGQLKQFTFAAISEMDADLAPVRSGRALYDLTQKWFVGNRYFGPDVTDPSDLRVVNLAGLKKIGRIVWTQLQAAGYTGTSGIPPWLDKDPAADPRPATVGQLKAIFDFDLTTDTNGNGLPDWWEKANFPNQTIAAKGIIPWSRGHVTYLQAYQNSLTPENMYKGQDTSPFPESGFGQTGPPGGFLPAPLVVEVRDSSNVHSMIDAPVTFTITLGGGALFTSRGAKPALSRKTFTDFKGHAQIYIQLPDIKENLTKIIVTTGTASTGRMEFTAFSDDGTGQFGSPFAPAECTATMNRDGSGTLTWTNNTDNETVIYIEQQQPNGTWKQVASLPPKSTTYKIPKITPGAYRVDPITPPPPPPTPAKKTTLQADDYYQLGFFKRQSKDFDGAISDLTKAIQLDSTDETYHEQRAAAEEEKGDLDGAILDCGAAIRIMQKAQHTYMLPSEYDERASLKLIKGDVKGAIDDYTLALQPMRPPNTTNAPLSRIFPVPTTTPLVAPYYFRGIAKEIGGDLHGALSDLETYANLSAAGDPEYAPNTYVHLDIWVLLSKLGKKEEADKRLATYCEQWKQHDLRYQQLSKKYAGQNAHFQPDFLDVADFLLHQTSDADFARVDKYSNGYVYSHPYFAGIKRLLAKDKAAAITYFRRCVTLNNPPGYLIEYYVIAAPFTCHALLSHAELKRLGK